MRRLLVAVMVLALHWAQCPVLAQSVPTEPVAEVNTSAEEAAAVAAAEAALNLNLSSTVASLAAPVTMTAPVNVNLGGVLTSINPGSAVTPAQMVALHQVMQTGVQTLVLDSLGAAQSGTFSLSSLGQSLASLTIPQGVTVLAHALELGPLNMTGNLVNSGSFYLYSTNPDVSAASISALNILNNQGAVLSTALPSALLAGLPSALSSLSLNLSAINDIVNAGTIASSGNLSLYAGGSITNVGANAVMHAMQSMTLTAMSGNITNSGLMAASFGNINVNAAQVANMTVNNLTGVMQALNGSINFREQAYAGVANISLTGGDYLSQVLNLNGGQGTVDVNVNNVTGVLNAWAQCAHIAADAPLLQLGVIAASGDPYVTVTGNLDISSTTYSPYLVAIAGESIFTSQSNTALVTGGGNLVLIAGATPLDASGTCANCINVDRSEVGGDIYLISGGVFSPGSVASQDIISLDTSNAVGGGGNVILIAFSDSATARTTGGGVYLPTGLQIKANGSGTNSNGSLTVVAEASSGTAIEIGNFNTSVTSFGTGGGGRVHLSVATPNSGVSGPTIDVSNGNINGSFYTGLPADLQNGNINAGNIRTGGAFNDATHSVGSVIVSTGGSVVLGAIDTTGINGAGGAGGPPVQGFDIFSTFVGNPGEDGKVGGHGAEIKIYAGGTITTDDLLSFGGGGGGGGGAGHIVFFSGGEQRVGGIGGDGGVGGDGGDIVLNTSSTSPAAINVVGDINTSGGGGGGGSGYDGVFLGAGSVPGAGGAGGAAGDVSISAPSTFSLTGNIFAAGGGSGSQGFSLVGGGGGGSFGAGGGGGGGSSAFLTVLPVTGGGGGGGYFQGSSGSSGSAGASGFLNSGFGGSGGNGGSYANGSTVNQGGGIILESAGGVVSISSTEILGAVTGAINAGTGTVAFTPNPSIFDIYLAPTSTTVVPGAFNVNQTVFDQITTGSFRFNTGSNSNSIFVQDSFTASGTVTLETGTSGSISQTAGTITAAKVVLIAGGGIYGTSSGDALDTEAAELTATSSNGVVNISNTGDVVIGSGSGAGAGQSFSIATTGDINFAAGASSFQGTNLVLTSPGDIGTVDDPFLFQSGVSAGVMSISVQAGGGVYLVNELSNDTVNVLSIDAGSTTYLSTKGQINIVASTSGGSGISSDGNDITLSGIDIFADNVIDAGSATVKLFPADDRPIVVNGTIQSGSFNITGGVSGFIDQITAGTIIIGSPDRTGTTSLADSLNASGSGGPSFNLEFVNNGAFNAAGRTISIGDNSLTITTDESVTLDVLNIGANGAVEIVSGQSITASVLNMGEQSSVEITSGLTTRITSIVLDGTAGQTGGSLSINSLGLGSSSAFVIGSLTANGIWLMNVSPGLGFDSFSIVNNGSIVIQDQLKGSSVNLTTNSTTGGSITDTGGGMGSTPSIMADSVTLQTTGTANNDIGVTIANDGVAPIDLIAVSGGGHVTIMSLTDVNIVDSSGAGNNKTFSIETGAGTDASIVISHDIMVGGANGVIDLTADGAGTITRPNFAGTLFASNVNLASGSGDLGTDNSHIDMQTPNVTFSTTGSMYLQTVGAIVLPVLNFSLSQTFSFRVGADSGGNSSITLTNNGTNPTISAGVIKFFVESSGVPGFISQQALSSVASLSAPEIHLRAFGTTPTVNVTTTNNFNNLGVNLHYDGHGVSNIRNIGDLKIMTLSGSNGSLHIKVAPDALGNADISVNTGLFIHMPNTDLTLETLGALSTITTNQLATSSNNGGGDLRVITQGGDITVGDIFTDNLNTSRTGLPGGNVELITGTSSVNGGNIVIGNIKASSYTFPVLNNNSFHTNGKGGNVTLTSQGSTDSGFIQTGTINTEGDRGGGAVTIVSEFKSISTQAITTFNGARLVGIQVLTPGLNGGDVSLTASREITVTGSINTNAKADFLSTGNPLFSRTSGYGGQVLLHSDGFTAASGSITVTGDIITLGDWGAGDIVIETVGGDIQLGNIFAQSIDMTSAMAVYVSGSVSIISGTNLIDGGKIVVGDVDTSSTEIIANIGHTAGDVTLSSTGNNQVLGSITINGDINALGRLVNGNVTISTRAGDVIHASGQIKAGLLSLASFTGDFGTQPGLGGRAITTAISSLEFQTVGDVYVDQTGDLIIESSSVSSFPFSSRVEVSATGSIFLNGSIGVAQFLSLVSGADILNTPAMSGLFTLTADYITLQAAGTIGTVGDPLKIRTFLAFTASSPNFIDEQFYSPFPPPPPPPPLLGQLQKTSLDILRSEIFTSDINDVETLGTGGTSLENQLVANSNVNILQAGEQVVHDIKVTLHNAPENNINSQNFMGSSVSSIPSSQPATPKDDQALGQNFAYCDSSDFNASIQGDMHSHGATIGQQSTGNLCVLQQGNFMFQPQADISVQVQEGSVEIPKGATVLVMETGNDVAVFDINDGPNARVRVKSGNKIITLSPGKQVVLTRQLAADFDQINPSKLIGYKNPKSQLVASDIRAYSADFSLPSIMMSVAPMKRMLTSDSPADKKLVQRMIKNAVVLSMLPSKSGPFKSSGSTHR